MRIVLFVAFVLCSILTIVSATVFPQEFLLLSILTGTSLLIGVLMFVYFITNEKQLKIKTKEYYQYSFVKDDTIKKLEEEVGHKNEVIISFQNQIDTKTKEIEALTAVPQSTEEVNTLKNKVEELTTTIRQKEIEISTKSTEIYGKETEIRKLKLEVKDWCDKAQELNSTIAKPTKDAILIDDNHQEEENDDSEKTKKECLAFLEMIKWSNHNFNCSKCENTTFNTLENLNSRKCTKCNHIESAMAHTLYMGVRFPLDKAFDMTKAVMNNPKISIEQLMEETGLTKNTCWKFKNKILDQRTTFKKKFKRDPEHWEELIYIK